MLPINILYATSLGSHEQFLIGNSQLQLIRCISIIILSPLGNRFCSSVIDDILVVHKLYVFNIFLIEEIT